MSPTPSDELPPHVGVAVVGAGFAGIAMAHALLQDGRSDFVVLERGHTVGGTWRDNTYPGCACDVPSRLYSLSFAPNPDWTRAFSTQPEIQAYLERTAEEVGMLPHCRFGTDLQEAAWDDATQRWQLSTSRGSLTADVLVAGTGALSAPSAPDIPGIGSFAGTLFHSATWDHGHDLTGERVAVIGTGASAVQFVPQIREQAAHVTVFQRTPPWVLPRRDRAIGPLERALYRRFPRLMDLPRFGLYAMHESYLLGYVVQPRILALAEREAKRHIARAIADPELRAKVTPSFRLGCKRTLLSNDYYPALAQPDVTLETDRIVEVLPHAVVTAAPDGTRTEHAVDTLVLGTGFAVTDHPVAHHIRGRDGRTLAAHWAQTGVRALHGTTVAGFPNYFHLAGPHTGQGHTSAVYMVEQQVGYVARALRALRSAGGTSVEPRPEAVDRFVAGVDRRMRRTVWATGGCSSWYVDERGQISTLWPDFTFRFSREVSRFPLDDYVVQAPPEREVRRVRSADGTELHVELHGPHRAAVVVLVHGWTCSAAFWAPQVRELSKDLRVVTYDLRGHARSGGSPRSFSTDALADDLQAVLADVLPEGEQAVLVGHSMGAMSMAAWAGRHPEEVRRRASTAVLLSTGVDRLSQESTFLPLPRRLARVQGWAQGRLLAGPGPLWGGVPVLLTRWFSVGRGASPATVDACARMMAATPPGSRVAWSRVMGELDLLADLRALTVPATVVVGAEDRLTPPSYARRVATALPHLRDLVELPGVGHMTPLEAPDEITALIRSSVPADQRIPA